MNSQTLSQIEKTLKDILSRMATKDDLKRELSKYITKNDLKNSLTLLRQEIKEDIAQASMDVFRSADENKAEKEELVKLEKRVEIIENHLQISSL